MILSGWKEIARYMNRGVRTVQRWEKRHGLPVRRIGISKHASVNATSGWIDAWLRELQNGATQIYYSRELAHKHKPIGRSVRPSAPFTH